MTSKRKIETFELEFEDDQPIKKRQIEEIRKKKHTLDSDEEDSDEDEKYNVLPEDDIEGEEDGVSGIQDEMKITPFNMKEELEEGHFDKDGHFQWDKDKEIKDNWLDNIDWIKVKTDKKYIEKTNTGLADSSDSDSDETDIKFNAIETYKQMLALMQPNETVAKTLRRLGGKTTKVSSMDRWKKKASSNVDENAQIVTKFTELADKILTNTGNMDIYQETYELIEKKVNKNSKIGNSSKTNDELDMYADDFDTKEKKLLTQDDEDVKNDDKNDEILETQPLKWEFKWDKDGEVHGPFSTEQMQNWVDDNYFKDGVLVRKYGHEDTKFYTSNRIDFEIYL